MLAPKPFEKVTASQNTLVEQKKEYELTKSEWAADNREMVHTILQTGSTVYSVPEGKTLYITNCYVQCDDANAGIGYAFGLNIDSKNILRIQTATGTTNSHSLSYNCVMPIKVKDDVTLTGSLPDGCRAGFIGYLE